MPVGRKGAGQVTVTSFSVPAGSLDVWRTRLRARGVAVTDLAPRFGEPVIAFADASGLAFELIATERDARTPWVAGGFDAADAIRGLHSVTLVVRDAAPTVELMTRLLDYTVVDEMDGRIRLAVNGGGPGRTIDVAHDADAEPALNGLGTVHHVAMAIATADEQLRLREELLRYGCQVTEVRDRCYFQSIYFREPGGVLFEVATLQPGFAIDEAPAVARARAEAAAVGRGQPRRHRGASRRGEVLMKHFALIYEFVSNFVERRAPFREAHLQLLHDAQARGLLRDAPDRSAIRRTARCWCAARSRRRRSKISPAPIPTSSRVSSRPGACARGPSSSAGRRCSPPVHDAGIFAIASVSGPSSSS